MQDNAKCYQDILPIPDIYSIIT